MNKGIMYYVYRLLDKENNILYIGKTKNLESRIRNHEIAGHLKNSIYSRVLYVDYMAFDTKSDMNITEIYLINKYKPIGNSANKALDEITIPIKLKEDFKYFRGFKYQKPKNFKIINYSNKKINNNEYLKLKYKHLTPTLYKTNIVIYDYYHYEIKVYDYTDYKSKIPSYVTINAQFIKNTPFTLSYFIEILKYLKKNNKISYGIDYIIKKNETELALHTPTLHRKIIKYIKKEHIPIEIFTREQFTMQLRKSNCFIENKTVRFKNKTKKS